MFELGTFFFFWHQILGDDYLCIPICARNVEQHNENTFNCNGHHLHGWGFGF